MIGLSSIDFFKYAIVIIVTSILIIIVVRKYMK